MSDSSPSDELAAKHRANREARLEGVKRWVAYIRDRPPEVWGEQQNRVVNAQLRSARDTETPPGHERRVEAFGEAMTAADSDGSADSNAGSDGSVDSNADSDSNSSVDE